MPDGRLLTVPLETPYSQLFADPITLYTGHAPRLLMDPTSRQGYQAMASLSSFYASTDFLSPEPDGEDDLGCFQVRQEGTLPLEQPLRAGWKLPVVTRDNWPGPTVVNETPFPTSRRILRREIDWDTPLDVLELWFGQTGIQLGPLVPSHLLEEVKRTFWTYRDVGAGELSDLPPTDLYTHAPRMAAGVRPWNRSPRRTWTEPERYWLHRLVGEGSEAGMYEPTLAANGRLSDWAAEPVMVPKDPKDPWAEHRLTFNYSHVTEDLPGCVPTLLGQVHDSLADPRVGSYSSFDLKHAYWSIPVEPSLRHVFAFSIEGFPQMQPTRMPQGTQSAAFSMTEVVRLAMGPIPSPLPEPSLLHAPLPREMNPMETYMDDIFLKHTTFEDQWAFVRDHLLPRLLWTLMKISLKKVRLGMRQILAIGWIHQIGGIMKVKPERAEMIRDHPVPLDPTGVRSFLGKLGPVRKWIKNCSEISRPLTRLTGNVDWRWTESEAASFSMLKDRVSDVLEMFGLDPDLPTQLWSDASGYGAGCVVMQHRDGTDYPLLYDSFLFTQTQRNYSTYKRELCAITEFCRRHKRHFQSPITSTVYTDHKPLTWFLTSANHEGIYARWVTELRVLNIKIEYIAGRRNQAADALSRTIFPDVDCMAPGQLTGMGSMRREGDWVWKDGKGGYQELMDELESRPVTVLSPKDLKRLQKGTPKGSTAAASLTPVDGALMERQLRREWVWTDGPESTEGRWESPTLEGPPTSTALVLYSAPAPAPSVRTCGPGHVGPLEMGICGPGHVFVALNQAVAAAAVSAWEDDPWYSEMRQFLETGSTCDPWNRHLHRRLTEQSRRFRIRNGQLCRLVEKPCTEGNLWVRCLARSEVAPILNLAHDESGHFGPDPTRRRLMTLVWWPGMAKDIVAYVAGCLPCAKYGPGKPPSPPQVTSITEPFQVFGIDHVGPFPLSALGNRLLLVMVDYFSRYCWAFPCKTTQAEEAVDLLKTWHLHISSAPWILYSDPGSAFVSDHFKSAVALVGTSVVTAPTKAHRSVGMVEVTNKLVQGILGKTHSARDHWDEGMEKMVRAMNGRTLASLGYSPTEILFGVTARGPLEWKADSWRNATGKGSLQTGRFEVPKGAAHANSVLFYMAGREVIHGNVTSQTDWVMANRTARHEMRTAPTFPEGTLVMVVQEGKPPKLRPRWRGPFKVAKRLGRCSYVLENVDGTPIVGVGSLEFHQDHLKVFSPRVGYLKGASDDHIPGRRFLRKHTPS